jgi:hypothetical protein
MISEPINKPDVRAAWRHYEIMRPSSREAARLLTLGRSPAGTTFGFAARRPYGDFAVYNLYNAAAGARPLTLDFPEAGLPPGVLCAVFDFWENRVVGYATDAYTTNSLEHLSSALLRFTPLDAERPVLVGSNLHLSMGATEVDDVRVSPSRVNIELSDAGAQQGSLTFHSKQELKALAAENCQVTSVEDLGNNLWQVQVADRQWGQAQAITLRVVTTLNQPEASR